MNFEYVNFSSIDSTGARYNISYDRFDGDCFALGTWQTKYYSIKYAHREFWDPLDPELIYEGNAFLILMGFQTNTRWRSKRIRKQLSDYQPITELLLSISLESHLRIPLSIQIGLKLGKLMLRLGSS